jgi:TolB-like protein/Tfp pilus assembly protein PilF
MAISFVQELKRRNVFRVAIIYIVVSWLLMQVGDVMFPALLLPEWTPRMLIAFLILGLPIALIFAWAYEVTADGIKRTADVTPNESITSTTGRKIDFLIIGVLVIAVALLGLEVLTTDESVSSALSANAEKSIAVLVFKNQSASEENAEFFAAGVHDELITLLSKLGEIKVISRTSVERLDPNLSTTEIGTLLGVATVLEGQVQRAGDQLRINVQLIDTSNDDHIWANIYDRELTASNVFEVQSNIARTIATALHAELSDTDEKALAKTPTENLEALENFMLAGPLVDRGSFDSFRRAAELYVRATDLDPDYAEAWAALAHTYSRMYQTGLVDVEEYVTSAEPAVLRALRINDRLPAAHAELGILQWYSGDPDAAESAFRTALELNPNSPETNLAYGNYLRTVGRSAEAIPVLERSLAGDPLNIELRFELGKAEMYMGNLERTLAHAKSILDIDPSSVHGYIANLQSYLTMGRFDLAWPWYLKAMDSDPVDFELWAHAGYFAALLGASGWPDKYMIRAHELGAGSPVELKCRIHVHFLRGELDDTLPIAHEGLDRNLDDRWFSKNMFLRILRDEALDTGSYDASIARYREHRAELFDTAPKISVGNIYAAADLALLLQRSGETERAALLADAGLAWYEKNQPAHVFDYVTNIVAVHLLAVKGEKNAALSMLREAVDSGWAYDWFWHINNRDLDSIRDEPEFQKIVAELEAKMVEQLAAIEALPDMGPLDLRYK